MKKRLFCLFMSICMCLSLSVFAYAENIEGPITTEPMITQPTLEVSNIPQGAIAVAKNYELNNLYYYRVSGGILTANAKHQSH